MFYKEFLKIIDILNSEFVEDFDYWLAMLPKNRQENITASLVSSRLDVSYVQAEAILNYAENLGILKKYYMIKCPECDAKLDVVSKDEIIKMLSVLDYCDVCETYIKVTLEDVYTAYKIILQPQVTDDEIKAAIEKRLKSYSDIEINFNKADSILNDPTTLYETFYNPSESAYKNFKLMRKELDLDYGKNTTKKGNALEKLVLEIFSNVKMVSITNEARTKTNQLDCTAICGYNTAYLSVFSYLAPYFIIECKNELKKKPDNSYCNKLYGIMDTNEAQIGIVFGRNDATRTCFQLARDHYLTNKLTKKHKIVITFSDNDLEYIIDKRVNLLSYIEYKIMQVTFNTPQLLYEAFLKMDNNIKIC